ncbi:adenosylcobinamide-phosphate synthase CbiB [Butyrivibrio sp. AE3004]|uniref:adenosylcobinamide-phosphate synthase CbiB n=1 Tax=Butyrivibrio sp. AE3004 TaxID=1506994 RepID=UPI0004946608|nr:adenosylcobinamide-phosphate synthase CbiB [Butyrivibrio sp. AE3004]
MIADILKAHIVSLVLGIILDQIVGDPHSVPHPIRAIGNLIYALEKRFLGRDLVAGERNGEKEKRNGTLLWFIVVITVFTVTLLVVMTAYKLNKNLGIFAEVVLTCYILAARSLSRESMAVYRELQKGDINGARFSLSMIVGRDTDELSYEEITKAAVETVAENTSDGVIAPLIYTAIGGPVLGMTYKAVNTMDSMLGYKNERYENFGFFAAKADDVFNFIPSRLSALFMVTGAFVLGIFSREYSGMRAFKIWRRDRYNHKSPNSAQTESVCAGALGLKLGGTHLYKGVPVEKPTIGDEIRKAEAEDIKRAGKLMFITEGITAIVVIGMLSLLSL